MVNEICIAQSFRAGPQKFPYKNVYIHFYKKLILGPELKVSELFHDSSIKTFLHLSQQIVSSNVL